ncbi:MAG TPA: glycerol-3-phosphate 1-O-acyltransferase PlsY [Arenicellales bacterium]|jgi:glycerol-3-phosphate acyltransferase PlsY|nr:glycerol-3-phosphate 1-O-acyltransferase PlsY [Arenicellales bacterium]|tara:strand:+ start:2301 stop:2891 length:591 start_codon:yes stop_codon:yes gene_type:complete
MLYLLIPIAAYLIGSISSAILVSRLMGLPDPRTEGSHNPGATNVLRLGSKTGAALALAGDVAKGVIPVIAARWLLDDPLVLALAALGAFLGHLFPVFFRFEGGKGVATALGVLAALDWQLGGLLAGTWLVIALVSRYSSLAALTAATATPFYAWWLSGEWLYVVLGVALAFLLFLRHRQNISRLIAGTESRIGKKS